MSPILDFSVKHAWPHDVYDNAILEMPSMYTETKMPMIMLITIMQSIKEMNIIDTHIARNSCVAVEYFTYLVS